MALEQRVYEELTEIDPKVFFGLTWRQLIAVGVTALVGGLVIGGMWIAGARAGFTYAILPIAVPCIAWGWFKPLGLRVESWLAHSWKFWMTPTRKYYMNAPVWEWEYEQRDRKYVVGKQEKDWSEAGR